MRLLPLLLALSLAGCSSVPPQAKPSAPPAAIAPDPKPANAAQSSVNAAAQDRLSKLSANVNAAATAPNIEASPVAVNELTVAQGRLSDVKPDPVEVAAAAERRALQEAGRAAEARANAEAAADQGRTDAIRIAELQAIATSERARADAAVAAYAAQAEKNRIENQKAIDAALAKAKQARDELDNAERSKQVAWCNKIGFSALGIAVALMVGGWLLGGLAAIRKMGPAAGLVAFVGLCALWAARVLGHPWFMPGMTLVIVAVIAWVVFWWRKHDKRGDINEELAKRGAKAKATLEKLVPTIDAVYREGTQTVEEVLATIKGGAKASIQDLLDSVLFSKLSSKLDQPEKDTVKEVRGTVDPIQLS
jgi:hypothetical protein